MSHIDVENIIYMGYIDFYNIYIILSVVVRHGPLHAIPSESVLRLIFVVFFFHEFGPLAFCFCQVALED